MGFKNLVSVLKKSDGKILTPVIDLHLLKRNSAERHRDGRIHPSQIGRFEDLCAKEIFFNLYAPDSKVPKEMLQQDHQPRTHRIFDNGDFMHLRYQALLVEAGVMHPDKGVGWEIPIDEPDNLTLGHCDGIVWPEATNVVNLAKVPSGRGTTSVPLINADGFVYTCHAQDDHEVFTKNYTGAHWKTKGRPYMLELKSMNDNYFMRLPEPYPAHKMQATLYMAALRKKYPDLAGTIFIYESKNTQEMREFLFPFQMPAWSATKLVIDNVKSCQEKKILPKGVCKNSLNQRAEACPWMDLCFSTQNYAELVNVGAAHAKQTRRSKTGRR